jgi:hypothetical protein
MKAEGSGMATPVPMELLITSKAPKTFPNEFVGSNGVYKFRGTPGCPEIMFYMPFPFFCMGCCMFNASDLTFDDNTRTLTAETWTGHLHYFGCTSSKLYEYEMIGNVGFEVTNMSEGSKTSRTHYYEIVIVLRNGDKIKTGRRELGIDASMILVLEWHKFIFGRNNPNYVAPPAITLHIAP